MSSHQALCVGNLRINAIDCNFVCHWHGKTLLIDERKFCFRCYFCFPFLLYSTNFIAWLIFFNTFFAFYHILFIVLFLLFLFVFLISEFYVSFELILSLSLQLKKTTNFSFTSDTTSIIVYSATFEAIFCWPFYQITHRTLFSPTFFRFDWYWFDLPSKWLKKVSSYDISFIFSFLFNYDYEL